MLQETIVQDALFQEISTQSKHYHSTENVTTCPNCEKAKTGRFCSHCGAENVGHHDLSLKHFLHHSLHEFTHVEDSKILNTLKLLLFYPGKLTTEYFAGRKIRYMSPIRMFLISFALSLFVYTVLEKNILYSSELVVKMDTTKTIKKKIEILERKTQLSRPELYQKIDQNWMKSVHFLEFGFVLVICFFLKAMYFKRYLVEHVIFTLHILSFMMLYVVLRWPLYHFYGIEQVSKSLLINLGIPLISWVYISFALKQMYGQKWPYAIAKAFVIVLVYQTYNGFAQMKTLSLAMNQI